MRRAATVAMRPARSNCIRTSVQPRRVLACVGDLLKRAIDETLVEIDLIKNELIGILGFDTP
jgi:hypothetical protein